MDGDTDVPSVQQDFAAALYQLMHRARRKEEERLYLDSPVVKEYPNGIHTSNEYQNERAISNGDAKLMANGVSNHIEKIADAKNGIIAQGNVNNYYTCLVYKINLLCFKILYSRFLST